MKMVDKKIMSQADELIRTLQLEGITDPAVLEAIKTVPREKFIPDFLKDRAYDDTSLPIDCEQTISQPYIVGLMTQALLQTTHPQKILEIGTGSGYQTAILAKIFKNIWTIERIASLSDKAKNTLSALKLDNISYKVGNGAEGWQEAAPFDGIIVTAAAPTIPPLLLEQLNSKKGKMVIPLGFPNKVQELMLIEKNGKQIKKTFLSFVRFVPFV